MFAFGIGVGNIAAENIELASKFYSKFVEPIYVRSQLDLETLHNMNIEAELACDVVLLDPNIHKYLATGLKSSNFNAVILPKLQKIKESEEFRNNYLDLALTHLRGYNSLNPTYFLDYKTGRRSFRHQSDARFWRNEFPNSIRSITVEEFMMHVSESDLFLSGRLHTSIFRLFTGKLAHVVPYQNKFELLKEFSKEILIGESSQSASYLVLDKDNLSLVVKRGEVALKSFRTNLASYV